MLTEKKQYKVEFGYRGRHVIMVAADGVQDAIDMAITWFLETRKPDTEWRVISAKQLSHSIVYEA